MLTLAKTLTINPGEKSRIGISGHSTLLPFLFFIIITEVEGTNDDSGQLLLEKERELRELSQLVVQYKVGGTVVCPEDLFVRKYYRAMRKELPFLYV